MIFLVIRYDCKNSLHNNLHKNITFKTLFKKITIADIHICLINKGCLFAEGKRNGFYIEAGGLDGEEHSNTLLFELERNYSGTLEQCYYKKIHSSSLKIL